MAPKHQLEKLAWAWAETTDPANITAEHVEAAFRVNFSNCKKGVCRKNCAGNPHCFNGLGEREWQKDFEDSYWHDIADPNAEKRKEGVFVGLQNLGATCYVNTFLQLWFANPVFRSAIFKWQEILPWESMPEVKRGEGDADTEIATNNSSSDDLFPSSVAGHLQLIFALLKFSVRRYIDPSPLMRFLGLDTGQQQDAQEFSKLFVSLLEDTLRSQDDPLVANLVKNQFLGSYSYITECSKCKGSSYSASQFYELDLTIKGQRTSIEECIEEFLKEEKLEGDNMYFCEKCGSKQNAGRRIKLTDLPPVLNMQLLRFVFERTTGHKKKLNSYLQFPEELNMGKYVGSEDDNFIYELQAVLIHRGPSAYSGHYIAHILDTKSDVWYKFNDEDTEKIGSRNLHLGNEEEIEGKSTAKKPRTPKGSHTSKNAYMLVYRRKGSLDPSSIHDVKLEDLPDLVKSHVENDNKRFFEWVKEMTNMRDANVVKGKAKQQEVIEMYKMFPVKKGEMFELISTKWLMDWLRAETVAPPAVDNSQLFCGHGRVDPEKVTKMKYLSTQAAEVLYSKYDGKPRLTKNDFCLKCIQNRCREIHVKAKVDKDSKIVTELLKDKSLHLDPEKCHWVGKKSLRSWRRLVIEQLEEEMAENKGTENPSPSQEATQEVAQDGARSSSESPNNGGGEVVGGGEVAMDASFSGEKSSEKREESDWEDNGLKFNQDLLCLEHGSLIMDESVRRLVASEVWTTIKDYFPSSLEFKGTCSPCQDCVRNHEESVQKTEQCKMAAAQQKNNLLNLFHDRNRPVWSKNVRQLMVASVSFVETWRSLIRDPGQGDILQEMNNRSLLCDHGGFLYEPAAAGYDRQSESALVLLWPDEWSELIKYYKVDVTIAITRLEEEQHVTYISEPDVCQECLQHSQATFRSAMLTYEKAIIYVRKVINEKVKGSKVKDTSGTNSPTEELNSEKDPEFVQENGKRKKTDDWPPEKSAKIDMGVRRSSRHRKQRGEKEVEVSSTQTLWDLKMQLMKLFSAPPMDQHLMLEGVELKGDKQALHTFNIFPESVLYLNVDEPCDDPMFLDDISQAGSIEVGFKGTGLLGR